MLLGEHIRSLREQKQLLLRQVAAAIAMDQALLSKIERSERNATRQQIVSLANFFQVDQASLISQWWGEKIASELAGEHFATEALETAKAILKTKQIVNQN